MYCLFVNALYDWYITKTNSCVHLNVTDVIDEYIYMSLYIYMSFPSCEYRQAAADFKSKDQLNSDTVHWTGRRHVIVLMVITISIPETRNRNKWSLCLPQYQQQQ